MGPCLLKMKLETKETASKSIEVKRVGFLSCIPHYWRCGQDNSPSWWLSLHCRVFRSILGLFSPRTKNTLPPGCDSNQMCPQKVTLGWELLWIELTYQQLLKDTSKNQVPNCLVIPLQGICFIFTYQVPLYQNYFLAFKTCILFNKYAEKPRLYITMKKEIWK